MTTESAEGDEPCPFSLPFLEQARHRGFRRFSNAEQQEELGGALPHILLDNSAIADQLSAWSRPVAASLVSSCVTCKARGRNILRLASLVAVTTLSLPFGGTGCAVSQKMGTRPRRCEFESQGRETMLMLGRGDKDPGRKTLKYA